MSSTYTMICYSKENGRQEITPVDRWRRSDDLTLHREDGPAIENGRKNEWWYNGQRHRAGGPAITFNGQTEWWVNGELHREDGPAIEYANGTKSWYRAGKRLRYLGRAYLTRYMELKGLTIAHLLLDPDPMIRDNASKTRWRIVNDIS